MRQICCSIIISIIFSFPLYSQAPDTCFVYQPGSIEGKDVRLNSLEIYGGDQIELPVDAWTWYGVPGIDRSLIAFDLSNIPASSMVLNATLKLYGAENLPTGGHSTLSGSNEFIVQRITSSWDEGTVSWATHPQTTDWKQVILPASQDPHQDYEINVTELAQYMVAYPDSNFGFLLKLQTEEYYRMINFASSDHPIDSKHPKLTVCVQIENGIETLIDSMNVCSGDLVVPIQFRHLYNATESLIQLSYDTLMLSYLGYQHFTDSIPADSVSVDESYGVIRIYWKSPTTVNLLSDTLIELLFKSADFYSPDSITLDLNDSDSYYKDSTGLFVFSDYYDGQIIINPIPDPFIFVTAPDSVCQGAKNVFYGILPIQNADSIVWELIPPGAGTIIGEGESIYVNYAPDFYGEAYLTGYGVNACGPGDAATYLTYIIGSPIAEAGPSAIICQNTNHPLSGYASNYSVAVWTTTGDGSFEDPFMLNTTYYPGTDDIQNGDVYLVLYACAIHPCFGVDPDTMLLTIKSLPDQPQTPTGPASIIIEPNLTTDYFTNSVAHTNWYQWHLSPGEAGLVNAIDTSAAIQWNEAFFGSIAYLNVEAANNCGEVSSDSLIINISSVGIKEKNSSPDITIAPNPSIGVFNISINGIKDDIKLSVVNTQGNVILQQIINSPNNQNTFNLDISNEPSGVYYLKFDNQNYSITKKVIVKAHP